MQVPVFTICYTAANVSNPADRIATGGGRSRAATSFACGAGTLWRGFAGGLRMTPLPSKQTSFPNADCIATGGGRSRAATPFACGAGTLWRGFAGGLRMTPLPSKQPSFPNADRIATGGGRSRATTSFACGAGTLWRGFAGGLRMRLLPSKQPSFPNADRIATGGGRSRVTPLPTSPIQLTASPLASLSPQRGEGLRVRGGHIQSCPPSVSSCISPIRGPG